MKTLHLIYIAVCIAALGFLQSCRTHRETVVHTRDSVITQVRWQRIVERDTFYYQLPAQTASVQTRDSVSYLENDFAVSWASVDSAGMLRHTLQTKNSQIPVPTDKTTITRDSVVYRDREVAVPQPYAVEVPAQLGACQKVAIRGFWILLAIIIAAAAWKWRRPLARFIRRIAGKKET